MSPPKHGELRNGERWDGLAKAWLRADVWQEKQWAREDAAFARKANQGELTAPMIIKDSQKTLQSMASGKWYDSKSEMRKDYKRHGCIEVGNENPGTRFWHGDRARRPANYEKKLDESVGKAIYEATSNMSDLTLASRAAARRPETYDPKKL